MPQSFILSIFRSKILICILKNNKKTVKIAIQWKIKPAIEILLWIDFIASFGVIN